MQNQNEVLIKMVTDLWNSQVARTTKVIEGFTDEQLSHEVATSRNTGTYVFGHLTAVQDSMLPLLGLGDKMHPELEEIFIKNPDKSGLPKPTVQQLRNNWNEINSKLTPKLNAMTINQWFEKHNSVTAEEFVNEPHRNRMNVVLSRITHLNYHLGQINLLNK